MNSPTQDAAPGASGPGAPGRLPRCAGARRSWVLLIGAALLPMTAPIARGQSLRPGDELWIISTRGLPYPTRGDGAEPTVRRFGPRGQWQRADLGQLYAAPPLTTLMYVHGNRVEEEETVPTGWLIYREIVGRSCEPPVRVILWSWPADRIRGQLRDVRAKADRADVEGLYLAPVLNRLRRDNPVGLIGYSFGARTICGALQLVGGGSLYGRRLDAATDAGGTPAGAVQVALLAAAMDADSFLPGELYPRTMHAADRLLVLYNSCDPVLKRYRCIDRCSHTQALGYVGAMGRAAGQGELVQRDACASTGRSHELERILASPSNRATIRRYVLPVAAGFPENAADTTMPPGMAVCSVPAGDGKQ